MRTAVHTQAEDEVVQFLTEQPTPEQIVNFRLSDVVAERFYELVHSDRERELSADEAKELETYLYLEHLLESMKVAAHRKLQARAS